MNEELSFEMPEMSDEDHEKLEAMAAKHGVSVEEYFSRVMSEVIYDCMYRESEGFDALEPEKRSSYIDAMCRKAESKMPGSELPPT